MQDNCRNKVCGDHPMTELDLNPEVESEEFLDELSDEALDRSERDFACHSYC